MIKVSQNQLKILRSLRLKKNRDKENLCTIEGVKICEEALSQKDFEIHSIYATEKYLKEKPIKNYQNITFLISEKELESVSDLKNPNEIICILHKKKNKIEQHYKYILALDSIRDPGNLGTIVRCADWFGINKIILSENCVDLFNQKVIQSSMGSFLRIDVEYTNLMEYIKKSKKTVYAALLDGENLQNVQWSDEAIILIGSESHGISTSLLQLPHHPITIPKLGNAESLNAAIATSIICYAALVK